MAIRGSGEPTPPVAPESAVPFIDTDYFDFKYPSIARYIDAQYITSTEYVGTVMNRTEAFFGVNLADGRIIGYSKTGNASSSEFYARYVRGRSDYRVNGFVDNGEDTITDTATGLMWTKFDSGDERIAEFLSSYTNVEGRQQFLR